MSFFKDLKEDIAQSVNELTESLDENLAVDDEKTKETVPMSELTTDFPPEEPTEEVPELVVENSETEENEIAVAAEPEEVIEEPVEAPVEEVVDEPEEIEEPVEDYEEEDVMNEEVMEEASIDNTPVEEVEDAAQEVTVITKGTTITGKVAGNTIASEIYVNTPRLEGDINSRGIVKIDVGTVVIGSISCTSVLVAGAVKGNIEVNGPVIVDSTAVVKGDIKAKSIQINSGAVIDGHCSLAYADVDLDSFFE